MPSEPWEEGPLDELLDESVEELEAMDRLLARLYGGRRHAEDPFLVIAHAAAEIPAPAMSRRPEATAGEDALAQRAQAAVRSLLARLEQGADDARPRVAALLALPRAERWREADENPLLHEIPVVAELLRRAEQEGLPSAEVEAIALLVVQLAPRARLGDSPARWLGDFLTRAWVLLAELALERRDAKRADFAVECARAQLATGSGDGLLAFEVGLRWAFLEWAEGRGVAAATSFKVVGRLGRSLDDPRRTGEVWLWLYLLYDQLAECDRAATAYTQALSLLGPDIFQQALRSHVETAHRLGLDLPPRDPAPGKEPAS